MLNRNFEPRDKPVILGSGLVVLDIILDNGSAEPIFSAGGTCGNVLAGLSYLGWHSICISRSGKDTAGDLLIHDLVGNGVDTSKVTREEGLFTPRIVEKISSDGNFAKHSFLLRCPTCGTYLPRFQSPRLDQVADIHRSGVVPDIFFFDRVTPSALKLCEYFRDKGCLIFFEPGKVKALDAKVKQAIEFSHIVKVTGKEVPPKHSLGNYHSDLKEFEDHASGLLVKTIGKHGLLFRYGRKDEWHYQPGYRPIVLHDCCGAGDWCSAGFLYRLHQIALREHLSILESVSQSGLVRSSLEFAQMLSALSCSFVGARGVSQSMPRNEVIDTVYSRLHSTLVFDSFSVENFHKERVQRKEPPLQTNTDGLCRTCLMMTEKARVARQVVEYRKEGALEGAI